MFPLGVIFYTLVTMASYQLMRDWTNYSRRENTMFFVSGVLTWMGVALYWWLLWRGSIRWDSKRKAYTGGATAGSALVGIFSGICGAAMAGNGSSDFGVFFGGLVAIVTWLVATVFIWRETSQERKDRIKKSGKSTVTCPTCGYNLTGLSESRCPECGSKFTLDELMAAQVGADVEIE